MTTARDILAATCALTDLEIGPLHCLSPAFMARDFSDDALDAASIGAKTVEEVQVIAIMKALTVDERRHCWERADQLIWGH